MRNLGKYSFGHGDRFSHQGKAQLRAIILAQEAGAKITPVWNKSYREHQIVKSKPADTRKEADSAVRALGWENEYFVDADHVGLKTVDLFLDSSDFFTLDVADFIGKTAGPGDTERFLKRNEKFLGKLQIPAVEEEFEITGEMLRAIAAKFLFAVQEAGRIYRHIAANKIEGSYVIEVSMDETDEPQTPVELLFILEALSSQNIPVRTIAPKFTGRFNKGVNYVGDVAQFTKEFEQDLAVVAFAIREFKLPEDLKLSVHSGSDKFDIYEPIRQALKKFDAGLHLKTAGTTWLEELIGLAEAGGIGLKIVQEVYRQAYHRFDELCKPYATVIDIDRAKLPSPDEVDHWDGSAYAKSLRHDLSCKQYNAHFRQLLHVGYKVAAEMGDRYLDELKQFRTIIAKNVTENLFRRHIKPLFLDK